MKHSKHNVHPMLASLLVGVACLASPIGCTTTYVDCFRNRDCDEGESCEDQSCVADDDDDDETTREPTGGSGGQSEVGGGGGDGVGGEDPQPPPADCNPLQSACVSCGTKACDSPQVCCQSGTSSCTSQCESDVSWSCDGSEDCSGGACCVDVTFSSNVPSSGETSCESQCSVYSAFSSSGQRVRSVACRSSSDCAGVVGSFELPFGNCCHVSNFDVGVCANDTAASNITSTGGYCN